MTVEHRQIDADRVKAMYLQTTRSLCHSVYHDSHMNSTGSEPSPPMWKVSDLLSFTYERPYLKHKTFQVLTKGKTGIVIRYVCIRPDPHYSDSHVPIDSLSNIRLFVWIQALPDLRSSNDPENPGASRILYVRGAFKF